MGLQALVMDLAMSTGCTILRNKKNSDKSKGKPDQGHTQLKHPNSALVSLVCEGRVCLWILLGEFLSWKCRLRKASIISQWTMFKI